MRSLAVTFLALATAFAGCVTTPSAETPNGGVDAGATGLLVNDATAILFDAGNNLSGRIAPDVSAVMLDIGHVAAEPTVAVTSDGTLFYAAITFDNDLPTCGPPADTCLPRTDILRSTDGGQTWEDATPYLPGGLARSHFDTGDPYVYVDPATDRVFDIDQRFAVGQYSISYSDDKGATWTGPFFACDAPPCDHHTLVAFKPPTLPSLPTYPNHLMVCYNQIHSAACKVSVDGGATWGRAMSPYAGVEPPGEGDPFSAVCGGLHGHVVAAPDGTVYLPKDHCGRPMVAVSQDGGLTWTQSTVSDVGGNGGADPVVAVDTAGNVYYAWNDPEGRLMFATSADKGATWSEALDITAPGLTATHLPAIAAGGPGKVALVYTGTDDPEGYERDEEEPNALWHGYMVTIEDALAPAPVVMTTRVNPIDDPLVRGVCGPGRCPAMYDFIDVIIDTDGRPWGAFADGCTEECVTDPEVTSRVTAGPGFVATLATGPSLLEAGGMLPPVHGSEPAEN